MEKVKSDICIYAACLASYNNGILHGVWIDASQDIADIADIQDDIQVMLKASTVHNAEEYAIHDYEGFKGADIPEYANLESIVTLATFIEEHGKLGAKLLDYFGDIEDAKKAIADHYYGEYKTIAEFAEDLTEQTIQIPETLQYYIDYERMARDLEINDILAIETTFEEIHIFWRF